MKHNTIKITALILAVSILALAGCAQGPYEKRDESVSGFNNISLETFGEVLITQGSAVVWVENTLDVNVSSVGSVTYFGDPEVTQNISGLGSVNSKGKH